MMAWMSCLGKCIACGTLFSFNPERVPSLRVSLDSEGRWRPDPNGTREPICRECIKRQNKVRRERGIPETPILPGAYEPEEVD